MNKFLFIFLILFPVFAFTQSKIDINTASLQELDKITGIGPAYAQRIVTARPFSSLDDLLKVKGIGEKTLQKIKEQGLAYVEGQAVNKTPNSTVEQNPIIETKKNTPPKVIAKPAEQSITGQPIIKNYPMNIFINEVMPNPEGSDTQEEWIELYNANDFDVDLSFFKIKDTKGAIKTYNIRSGLVATAHGFLQIKRSDTKISLNNDNDGLELLNPLGEVIDSTEYNKAPSNESYSKIENNWYWSKTPTPGSQNVVENLPNEERSVRNDSETEANISRSSGSPWALFFTATGISLFSAVILGVTKNRLIKQ